MKIKLKLNNQRLKKKDNKKKEEEYKPEWLKNLEQVTKNLNKNKLVKKEEDQNIVVFRSSGLNDRKNYSRKAIFDEEN